MRRMLVIVISAVLLALSSCNTLMPLLFGFREINGYDAEQCEKFYKKQPNDFEFTPLVCDEKQFWQVSGLGADSMQMKDLAQPLKIMYFHGDSLVSFHINCYCPSTLGFNLNWDYDHQFDVFPPRSSVALDGYKLKRADLQAIFPEIKGEADYTVLVFWTNMLHKVSKAEIRTVYRNLKKFCPAALRQAQGSLDLKAEIYLINNDIPLAGSLDEAK